MTNAQKSPATGQSIFGAIFRPEGKSHSLPKVAERANTGMGLIILPKAPRVKPLAKSSMGFIKAASNTKPLARSSMGAAKSPPSVKAVATNRMGGLAPVKTAALAVSKPAVKASGGSAIGGKAPLSMMVHQLPTIFTKK